jgi:hypothetical protein
MSDEPQGCRHLEQEGGHCNKVCDAGQTLCPYHLLSVQAQAGKRKPPAAAAEDGNRRFRTPRGYDE